MIVRTLKRSSASHDEPADYADADSSGIVVPVTADGFVLRPNEHYYVTAPADATDAFTGTVDEDGNSYVSRRVVFDASAPENSQFLLTVRANDNNYPAYLDAGVADGTGSYYQFPEHQTTRWVKTDEGWSAHFAKSPSIGSEDHVQSAIAKVAETPISEEVVHLTLGYRSGEFTYSDEDLSEEVALDTLQGIFIAPSSDASGARGAWVRTDRTMSGINVQWFGAVPDASVTLNESNQVTSRQGTDSYAAFQAADSIAHQHRSGLGTYLGSDVVLIPAGHYHLSQAWVSNSHYSAYGAYVDNTVVHERTEKHRRGLTVYYSPGDGFGIYRNQRGTCEGLRSYFNAGNGFHVTPDSDSYGTAINSVSANSGSFIACHAVSNTLNGWYLHGGFHPGGEQTFINDNSFYGCSSRTNLLDGVKAVGNVSYNTFYNLEVEGNIGKTIDFDDETRTVTFFGGYMIDAIDAGGFIGRVGSNTNTGMKSMFGTEVGGRIENITEGVYRDTHDNVNLHIQGGESSRARPSLHPDHMERVMSGDSGPHTVTIDAWEAIKGSQLVFIDSLRAFGQRSQSPGIGPRQKWYFKYSGILSKETRDYDDSVSTRWKASNFDYKIGDQFIQLRNADSVPQVYEVPDSWSESVDSTSTLWDAAEEARFTAIGDAPELSLEINLEESLDVIVNNISIDHTGLIVIDFNTDQDAGANAYSHFDYTKERGFL